jgi:hypothetical protein
MATVWIGKRYHFRRDVCGYNTRVTKHDNKPEQCSLWGWVFWIITLLALCYWLVWRVLPAIFAW